MSPPDGRPADPPPSAEERRRAACGAMAAAPGLVRYAARFTRSLPDAEDAYQRAMEIALTSAPVVEPRRFRAWLHTVVRNEALAITRARRREGPAGLEDAALTVARSVEAPVGPEALTEWRQRYREVQDALADLTESQRICVMLKTAGASYAEIAAITGFSLRKVERSVLEGRAGLHAWEARMAAGEECERVRPALERVADGAADRGEARRVSRHVRHCHGCRGLLRARRRSYDGLASLVPPALIAGGAVHVFSADPSPALGYWDRLSGGAVVRVGQAWQTALELPGAVTAKVGAGAAAAVLAGAAGGPAVVDAVKGSRHERAESQRAVRHVAAAVRGAVGPIASAKPPARRSAATRPPGHPAVPLAETTLRRIAHVAALVGRPHRPVHPAPAAPAPTASRTGSASATPPPASPSPHTTPAPSGSSGSSVALEFGP